MGDEMEKNNCYVAKVRKTCGLDIQQRLQSSWSISYLLRIILFQVYTQTKFYCYETNTPLSVVGRFLSGHMSRCLYAIMVEVTNSVKVMYILKTRFLCFMFSSLAFTYLGMRVQFSYQLQTHKFWTNKTFNLQYLFTST